MLRPVLLLRQRSRREVRRHRVSATKVPAREERPAATRRSHPARRVSGRVEKKNWFYIDDKGKEKRGGEVKGTKKIDPDK